MDNINSNEGFANLFSFFIFILILILFLYFAYKQIKNIFKIEDFVEINNKKEELREKFSNLYSLNDFLFDVDNNGELEYLKNDIEKKNILQKVIHKKNNEVKERENITNKIKPKNIKKENNKDTLYIVDKNSNKKHIQFNILNEKKEEYLTCNGFYDEHIVINIKDKDNKEITKIINKIYNKYTFVYQTKDDNGAINYFIEYRPSQDRFIKLYNQNEDKVFYIEKIFYKEKENKEENVPLYKVYYYANEIGTIYSDYVEDNETKIYKINLNEEYKNNKNIISFSFILYLAFIKDEL